MPDLLRSLEESDDFLLTTPGSAKSLMRVFVGITGTPVDLKEQNACS